MSLAILFHFLCTQHVSDMNISIIRSLRLCCSITTSVVLFYVRCVLETWCGWVWVVSVLQAEASACNTNVVIEQYTRKFLMMDIFMSETCWVHEKWNKISSDIKLVFYSSTITMKHGPINIRFNINSLQLFIKLLFHHLEHLNSLGKRRVNRLKTWVDCNVQHVNGMK